jgi:hypothetical protein
MAWRIETSMSEMLSEEPILVLSDRSVELYLELPVDVLQQDTRGGRAIRCWIGDRRHEYARVLLCVEDEGIIHMDLRVRVERAEPVLADLDILMSVLRSLKAHPQTMAQVLHELRRCLPQSEQPEIPLVEDEE